MNTTELKNQMILAAALILLGRSQATAVAIPTLGTLNITIVDDTGALVAHAPVYIYGEAKTKFIGGKEISGTDTLTMPAGSYRISSALMRKTGAYYDRYASREAHVEVVAGDNTTVILHLRALENAATNMGEGDVSTIKVDGFNDGDQIARSF